MLYRTVLTRQGGSLPLCLKLCGTGTQLNAFNQVKQLIPATTTLAFNDVKSHIRQLHTYNRQTYNGRTCNRPRLQSAPSSEPRESPLLSTQGELDGDGEQLNSHTQPQGPT